MRFFVDKIPQRMKTSAPNVVKSLHGEVSKAIWSHNHPVNIKRVTEESPAPAEQVTHPTQNIRCDSGIPPVSAPAGTIPTPYAAKTNRVVILD